MPSNLLSSTQGLIQQFPTVGLTADAHVDFCIVQLPPANPSETAARPSRQERRSHPRNPPSRPRLHFPLPLELGLLFLLLPLLLLVQAASLADRPAEDVDAVGRGGGAFPFAISVAAGGRSVGARPGAGLPPATPFALPRLGALTGPLFLPRTGPRSAPVLLVVLGALDALGVGRTPRAGAAHSERLSKRRCCGPQRGSKGTSRVHAGPLGAPRPTPGPLGTAGPRPGGESETRWRRRPDSKTGEFSSFLRPRIHCARPQCTSTARLRKGKRRSPLRKCPKRRRYGVFRE